MSLVRLSRFGIALFLSLLIAGCGGPSAIERQANNVDCRWNVESCMYDGSYEPGEREYAEQQAKDLNREAARKIRRRSIWGW